MLLWGGLGVVASSCLPGRYFFNRLEAPLLSSSKICAPVYRKHFPESSETLGIVLICPLRVDVQKMTDYT